MRPVFHEKSTAITGIGLSEVGRPSRRGALELTADACLEALADAGLRPADIDGLATWPGNMDNGSGFAPVGNNDVKHMLGLEVDWHADGRGTAGQIGAVANAAAAIAAGYCRHVLIFRTICEATARVANRQAAQAQFGGANARAWGVYQWLQPMKANSPAIWIALYAQKHFHQYGTRPEQLAQIALNARRNAGRNPKAALRKPLTLDDYLQARIISSPLRLYDCDLPVDGCTAIVLSHIDAARDLPNPPLRLEAVGAALHRSDSWFRLEDLTVLGHDAARMMWSRTTMKPHEIDVAQVYDGFSILTLLWLESLGFCGRGESGAFVEGGHNIALDGRLPINTGGGQLSAGRLHGYGHLHEACMQLWGRGGERQVPKPVRSSVVSNNAAGSTGCMLLVRE